MADKILVVDDREGVRSFIAEALDSVGYETETASDGYEATVALERGKFNLMITDLKMPRMDGMQLLEKAQEMDPRMPVIMLTAHGTIDNAVEAMKLGAFDYLTKPLEGPGQLRSLVKRALEHRGVTLVPAGGGGGKMLAEDPAMVRVAELISKVAPTDATVLLQGESGTGKEVAAREIHLASKRSQAPFVAVNCGAMSPQLVESEMFGHEKGSFTGASERHEGRFEAAHGGTLFLDEVGELPLPLQVKLLRALQERRFERVGGNETIDVDVRVLAATNRNLTRMIADGEFREDLFHRLSVFPITLPPLRERPGDLEPLASRLLEGLAQNMDRPTMTLSRGALEKLRSHSWPGNVRELSNTLERASIMADGDTIHAEDLMISAGAAVDGREPMEGDGGPATLKDLERDAIVKALKRTDGHRKKAADMLGIGLRTLYNKIKEYGLE